MKYNTLKINDFVEDELEMFRKKCNFSEEELRYFNLRAKGKSNFQIAIDMNVSEPKVSKLAKCVKIKIMKVV